MKILKILMIIASMTLVSLVQANIRFESTSKTKPIVGYPPYMLSVGSILDLDEHSLFDENNQAITTVNSIIYIPSTFCEFSHNQIASGAINDQLLPFYHFNDQDLDDCAANMNNNLTWYMLDLPVGKEWSDINAWSDLVTTEIPSEHFISSIPESRYSPALKIPNDAAGKRIGFIYTPIAKTGNPAQGLPIKVWDLDYFFGQEPYEKTGIATEPNDGKKLTKITRPSGSGTIVEAITPPTITNLHMKGIFSVDETLEAEFNFIANTTQTYEDVSRLWWGKSGTTETLANINNKDYRTERSSPKLTSEDIATVYEVSVLPIKKEAGYLVVGKSQTVKSDDPENDIFTKPKIENLKFDITGDQIKVNHSLSATYTFNNGGNHSLIDNSTYYIRIYNPTNQSEITGGGTVNRPGIVPNVNIKLNYTGFIVELTVQAKDQFGRVGEGQTITAKVEHLDKVSLSPALLNIPFGDTEERQVQATAHYTAGTQLNITSYGTWSSNDSDVLVNRKGAVSISPDNTTAKKANVNFTYGGKKEELPVSIFSNSPKILSLDFTNDAKINSQVNATYVISHEGLPQAIDQSYYIWKYADNLNSTSYTVLSEDKIKISGEIPASPKLDSSLQGKVLALELYPMNNIMPQGENITIKTVIESLTSLQITPSSIELQVGTNTQKQSSVMAVFSKGTQIDATKLGTWQSDNPLIKVSQGGLVSISPSVSSTIDQDITGTITFSYLGKSASVPVTIKPREIFTISLRAERNNAIANEESNSVVATVVNRHGQPVENITVYFKVIENVSGIYTSPSYSNTDSSGRTRVTITKDNNLGGTFNIKASVKNNQDVFEENISVNFLTLRGVNRIIAPKNLVFVPNQRFPTTGFPNATFNIDAASNISNSSLSWSSSDTNAATVDSSGNVTLYEGSLRKEVQITARDTQNAYRYSFMVNNWFIRLSGMWTYDNALIACTARGMSIPSRTQLSKGKNVRGIGSLWSEWHKPNDWLQALNSHHWSSTENSFRRVFMIDIETGDNSFIKGNDGVYREYAACVK